MKHISDVVKTILPFKLDNIRELSKEDLESLKTRVNAWLKARFHGTVEALEVSGSLCHDSPVDAGVLGTFADPPLGSGAFHPYRYNRSRRLEVRTF